MKYFALILMFFVLQGFANIICPPFNPDDEAFLIGDPFDCTKFYRCSEIGVEKLSCPESLVFNNVLKVCDYPWTIGSCGEGGSSNPGGIGGGGGGGGISDYYKSGSGQCLCKTSPGSLNTIQVQGTTCTMSGTGYRCMNWGGCTGSGYECIAI